MKEYSERIVTHMEGIDKYLNEQAKEGWDVLHIQKGYGSSSSSDWYVILTRDAKDDDLPAYPVIIGSDLERAGDENYFYHEPGTDATPIFEQAMKYFETVSDDLE